MSEIYYMSSGDTPTISGVIEREVEPDVWEAEDLSNASAVTISMYLANGKVYKADAAVVYDAAGNVTYTGVVADSQQGAMTGKFRVTYANGVKRSFPNTGRFQIRVSP